MDSTILTASVGQLGGDKVPASRSILLDLEAGEKVAIFQTRKGAESSYRLTFCVHLIRPSAPADWEVLPVLMKTPEIDNATTYTEPEQKPLTIDDLQVIYQNPEVKMPVAGSPLLFRLTHFFKKTPASGVASPIISLDPIDTAGNPNEI